MNANRTPRPPSRGPAFGDWALLAICVAFCALSVFIFPSNWRLAVTTFALFGGGAIVAIVILRRKLRAARFAATATDISVAPGVELRAGRMQSVGVGAGLLVVGLVIALVDPSSPWLIRGCGFFMAVVGVVVLVMAVSGRINAKYLRFEVDGLVLGRAGYTALIPWDALASIAEAEISNNGCVVLQLTDAARVVVTPASARGKFEKELNRNRRLCGHDVLLMGANYGVNAALLAAVIARYASSAEARADLAAVPASRRVGTAAQPQ